MDEDTMLGSSCTNRRLDPFVLQETAGIAQSLENLFSELVFLIPDAQFPGRREAYRDIRESSMASVRTRHR